MEISSVFLKIRGRCVWMDEPVNRRHIAFELWPDSTEEQALTNLRKQIHILKTMLPESDTFLEIQTVKVSRNFPEF
jgi:DNA-binding SARP family transcriptional activator